MAKFGQMILFAALVCNFMTTSSSKTTKILQDSRLNSTPQTSEKLKAQKEKFAAWKKTFNQTQQFNKTSEPEAEKNFLRTDEKINKFNSQRNRSYKLSHNKFSAKSFELNKKLNTGLKVPLAAAFKFKRGKLIRKTTPKFNLLPESVNYTILMKPVKDQKSCGACYVFAALAAVEYYYKLLNKTVLASEQNVIDCDTRSYGCNGGWPGSSLQYARDFGVSDGKKYRQANSSNQQSCLRKEFPPVMNISMSCEENLDGDEARLKELVAKRPVVVGFHVTENFMYYKSGVFSDKACNIIIDHAVLVVGYGTDPDTKQDYWIIRNSWSEVWGMRGYGLIARNAGNLCGIAEWAMYIC